MPTAPLLPLVRPFVEKDPLTAAHTLETLPEEDAVAVLRALPAALTARIFPHLQVSYAAALLREAEPPIVEAVVRGMDPRRAATIFMHLPEEARQRFLPHVPDRLRHELHEHLTYPEDSVGRLMRTDVLAFNQNIKVERVIRRLRAIARRKQMPASYVYVLDDDERLVGVLNMHGLVLASPEQTLRSIMRTDVFALHAFTDREEAAAELGRRRYFAAPVVDHDGRLLGIIRGEHLMAGMQAELTEDIQRMVGASADERAFSPFTFSLRTRLPWLHVNLLTAFLAAAVVALFEGMIAKLTVLAVFLPVVAGQGGNAGAQSLAIVMRGLVMREIPKERRLYLVSKEGLLGLINGAVTGAVTALVAWFWYGNAMLGLVVAMGMTVNLLFAGLAGASIPLIMKGLRLDPAQCSSIILTTVTDVVGFFAFLSFAVLFQNQLL